MTPLVLLAKPLYLSVNYARASHSESDVTIDEYIKATVMNVKETNNLKEDSTTNEWSSRNSVPEYTNLYRASTEWCEEPYEQSHKC